jgi:hypothetical protein
LIGWGCHGSQVALPHINAHDLTSHRRVGVGYLNFDGDQQVEPLFVLVIPEFGRPDVSAMRRSDSQLTLCADAVYLLHCEQWGL